MKKILDILIIAMFIFLFVNLFTNNNEEKKLDGKIKFETTESSYTIPANVGLNVVNNSTGSIKLNTCKNIEVKSDGEVINFPESFCKDIEVKSGTTELIKYDTQYDKFINEANYYFQINLDQKEYLSTVKLENRGSITKLFVTLFYAPIYNVLIYFVEIFNYSLGWAIIILTVILRLILIYPQHKMMVSQKKLQAIQPKIKKIQEEFKGNQQMLGVKLMELYKKEKVNPVGSCGPLLIQMPILIVMYNVILSIKDESNLFHLYSFHADFNLSSIEFDFFGLDLLQQGGIAGIVLGITVGLIQYIQVKLSLAKNKNNSGVVLEKKKNDNKYSEFMPDPEMMNKFMLYGMPAMIAVFTYLFAAGVGLYWGIATIFMIFQQLIVNKITK